jgi:hypothetical protein
MTSPARRTVEASPLIALTMWCKLTIVGLPGPDSSEYRRDLSGRRSQRRLGELGGKAMKVRYTGSRDGLVIIALEDEDGKIHEVELSTIDAAQLIGGLRASLEEAIGHPNADSMTLPGMERVQIVSHDKQILFRVYMNDRLSHEYPVPKGYLADELKLLANRVQPHNLVKAAHRPPDGPLGKH